MSHLALPLCALLVAPRPVNLEPCPPRARVEATYEASEAQGEQMEAEWLWPATVESLAQRLAASDLPAIGLVYLDVVVAQGAEGMGLCFEGPGAGNALLDPGQLGTLLSREGVPLMVLAATAGSGSAGVGNLARDLVAAGMEHVVALDEQMAIGDTTRAMSVFLSGLLAGQQVGQAVQEARLGTVHHSAADVSLFATMPGDSSGVGKVVRYPSPALAPDWQRLAAEPEVGGLPPEPTHGFVGRTREMLAIERALRGVEGNGVVLLHGYEGIGKTTLAAHAARWLVRTGRFAQVVYSTFVGGGHRESALHDLGTRLIGEGFSLDQDNTLEAVERALAETPTLILWDDFEAVLDEGEFPLGTERLSELLQLGVRLARGGQSRLCMISADPEIPDPAYREGTSSLSLYLGNLQEGDALGLLTALMASIGAGRPPDQEAKELVNLLGGQPLALGLLAPLLGEQSVSAVLARLEEIMPGVRSGEARLGNQALEVALEATLRSSGEASRPQILALGLFAGGSIEPLVTTITGLSDAAWETLAARLARAQVLRRVRLPGLNVLLLRLHPALSRHLSRRLTTQQRSALEDTYCGAYAGLFSWMMQDDRHSLPSVRSLVRCELPNLRRAFLMMLSSQKLNAAIEYLRPLQSYLVGVGFLQERDALLAKMQHAAAQVVPEDGPLARVGVRLLLGQGEQLMASGHVSEAGTLLSQLVDRMEKENGLSYGGVEAAYDHGAALHRLGRCAQASGRLDLALTSYMRALDTLNALQQDEPVGRELLMLYQNLGEAALASRQVQMADDAYRRALNLAVVLQDQGAQGTINAQLGSIALARDDVVAAKQFLADALALKTALDDTAGQAAIWSQLGTIAWRAEDLSEAERCLREACKLAEKAEQGLFQAQTLMQLALVEEKAERAPDAEADYAEAIRLCRQHHAAPALATAEMALAGLLLREDKLVNALAHAEAARVVLEDLGPEARPWESHRLLERIAHAQGEETQAAHWRMRAQGSYAASSEADNLAQGWLPMIQGISSACRGESLSDETLQTLEKLETEGDWQHLIAAIWRILGGERGEDLYAALDHVDALIVRRILEAIEPPPPEEGAAGEDASTGGGEPKAEEA